MTWDPTYTVSEDWGRLQVVMGTTDVTFLRGEACEVRSWSISEPFGDATCVISFPQVTPFERLGVGDLAAFADWADVTINRVAPDGSVHLLWEGLWASEERGHDEAAGPLVLHCLGRLFQADLCLAPIPFSTEPVDVGFLIADALAGHPSFRFVPPTRAPIGILAQPQGAWQPLLTGLVQDYLAQTLDDTGAQWTLTNVAGRAVLRLKDRSTVNWSLTTGTQGLTVTLARDLSMAPNALYGEVQLADGCVARNSRYPRLSPDDAPVWPGRFITVGTSGSDVLAATRRMHELGLVGPAHSTFTSADAKATRRFQVTAGLLVDGIIGPQTWAALFNPGANDGDLDGAFYAPFAGLPAVEPWLYNATGAILGPNPAFDRRLVRVERYENFGKATKDEAVDSAEAELARDDQAAYQGTLRLRIDPEEGSRFGIRAGQNVLLKAWAGGSVLLHIAQVEVDMDQLEVTLTVDERARDLPTLLAVQERRRDLIDPARRQRTAKNQTALVNDRPTTWDCESGAGRPIRFAVLGGHWTTFRVPAAPRGSIAGLEFKAETTDVEFAVGLFDRPIVPAELQAKGGAGDFRYWGAANWDKDSGLVNAWGEGDTLGGWYPYTAIESERADEGDPDADPAAHWTGVLYEDAETSYTSQKPPWVWLAVWATETTYITGRLFPGVNRS